MMPSRAARAWRVPIVLTALVVLLGGVAAAVAIAQLADGAEVAAGPSPTPAPTATVAAPAPTATPAPAAPTPTPSPSPASASSAGLAAWPAGEDGWTVIIASKTSEQTARDDADAFVAEGVPDVGLLHSDGFGSLRKGFWVVYSGRFDTRKAASDALDGIDVPDAYIRRVAYD